MDKKYIVTLADEYALVHKLTVPVTINGKHTTWIQTDINLTPYTEPDIEQVRKEAYERGYCGTLEKHCAICEEKHDAEEAYQQGLNDAWECAKKIFLPVASEGLPANALIQIFGNKPTEYILKEYSATEAIEKIRQYEQEKEEQIQVGDEVIYNDRRCVVLVPETSEKYGCVMDAEGERHGFENKDVEKTGRHFREIAEVLQKMKESDNG